MSRPSTPSAQMVVTYNVVEIQALCEAAGFPMGDEPYSQRMLADLREHVHRLKLRNEVLGHVAVALQLTREADGAHIIRELRELLKLTAGVSTKVLPEWFARPTTLGGEGRPPHPTADPGDEAMLVTNVAAIVAAVNVARTWLDAAENIGAVASDIDEVAIPETREARAVWLDRLRHALLFARKANAALATGSVIE